MNLECVIIDDEPLAINVIAEHIEKTDFLSLKSTFVNPVKAIDYLSENRVDLIFVDIQMPDISGIELVKKLDYKPTVIFTTAYDQYAVEGFKVDAVDYLLKPVDYPEFIKAVQKAKKWIYANKEMKSIKADEQFLFIKSEYKIVRIELNTIRYIEGMSEYVRIHRENAKPIMSLLSLKSLQEQLPLDKFMRVHKSYIVNLSKITEIEGSDIKFDGNVIVPVSKMYREKFQQYVEKNFMI